MRLLPPHRLAATLRLTTLLTAAGMLLLAGGEARAAWPTSPYTLGTSVRVLSGSSATHPLAAADGSGGVFMVWVDERSGSDIYAQHLNSAGTALWTANGVVVSNAAGSQGTGGLRPITMIPDGAGGILVAWSDNRNSGTTGFDLYAQRLNSSGARQWGTSDLLICNATSTQTNPVMASDGSGGAIIAWEVARAGNNDIYARRVLSSGTPSWTANGNVICNQAAAQSDPRITSSGSGGAIIVWSDQRNNGSTGQDLYAQSLVSTGAIQWTGNGVSVCSEADTQEYPSIVSDGLFGAVLCWRDLRGGAGTNVYAQRLDPLGTKLWPGAGLPLNQLSATADYPQVLRLSDGSFAFAWQDWRSGNDDIYAQRLAVSGSPLWGATGVPVVSSAAYEDLASIDLTPSILEDGQGGFFVACLYFSSAWYDIVVQHVTGSGAAAWGTGGRPLSQYDLSQTVFGIVPDGSGGIIVPYSDKGWSSNATSQLFAGHTDRYGEMRDARPFFTSIKDVIGDQGGQVALQWSASVLDGDPVTPLSQYTIWRKVPIASIAAAGLRWERQVAASTSSATPGGLRRSVVDGLPAFWEYVGASPARSRPGYSLVVPTTTDSVPSGNPRTYFMVSAERSNGFYWDSPADSGYSVDNLPPASPAPFTGAYSGGTTALSWGQNSEADFAEYRLYRGNSSGFTADPASRVAAVQTLNYTDAAGGPYWYKLTAVDVHGNESAPTVLLPSGTVGVEDGTGSVALALEQPAPHPVRAGGTSLRFSVPRSAPGSLALFDSQGRRVRTLVEGVLEAGGHSLRFEPADAAGRRLAPGLYFLRLQVGRETRVQRALVLD